MSSQPDFTTAETLRLWSQDCDPSMVRSLEQLAEQCEREMAAASSERAILDPVAKELQDALNWFFPERGEETVEPETFSCIKALKVITAGLSAKNQALTDRAAALKTECDKNKQLDNENSTLKAQLADARSALDVLHRALHGGLNENVEPLKLTAEEYATSCRHAADSVGEHARIEAAISAVIRKVRVPYTTGEALSLVASCAKFAPAKGSTDQPKAARIVRDVLIEATSPLPADESILAALYGAFDASRIKVAA